MMQRAIVTVKRQQESRVRDLEVPTDVEARRLAQMIAQALHWESDAAGQPIEYEIMAEPPGRTLGPQESLADAGAWDGTWLVFQPVGSPPPSPPPRPSPPPSVPGEGPVGGWGPWGIDLPSEPEQKEAPPRETGFVWKQLD
jgi:hypothetical protein